MTSANTKAGADIVFDVSRKANFYFGVMQRQPGGKMAYVEPSRLSTHVHIRGALLDRVVMTDKQIGSSAECYALEPPIGNYFIAGGQAGRVKDYPVVKPGTYPVVFNNAKTSPGPPMTQAEQDRGLRGHRTFLIQTETNTLFHYGNLPEWTEGCVTVGQKPKIVVLKSQTDEAGHSIQPRLYDRLTKGGENPALPTLDAQTEDKQQGLLAIAHATVLLQDMQGALGAMLRIYDLWKQRNGGEPRMEAVVSGLGHIPHFDLNDPLQCPMGRDLSY